MISVGMIYPQPKPIEAQVLASVKDSIIMPNEVVYSVHLFDLESPPPDLYEIKSVFDMNRSMHESRRDHNVSYCFGAGREAYSKVVMPAHKNVPDACVPGPGSYDVVKLIGSEAKQYSLGPRL